MGIDSLTEAAKAAASREEQLTKGTQSLQCSLDAATASVAELHLKVGSLDGALKLAECSRDGFGHQCEALKTRCEALDSANLKLRVDVRAALNTGCPIGHAFASLPLSPPPQKQRPYIALQAGTPFSVPQRAPKSAAQILRDE